MTQFVGIGHPGLYKPVKRDALLFDRIGMVGFDEAPVGSPSQTRAELEWLADRGVVFPTGLHLPHRNRTYTSAEQTLVEDALVEVLVAAAFRTIQHHPERRSEFETLSGLRERIADVAAAIAAGGVDLIAEKAQRIVREELRDRSGDIARLAQSATVSALQRTTRLVALQHRLIEGGDSAPIITASPGDPAVEMGARQGDVVRVILNALPQPDDSTPWESILDFRADEAAMTALRRLRYWMTNIGKSGKSELETRQELEFLYDSYTEHMHVHKMKIGRGVLESFVTATADIIENLAHLRFGQLARTMFSVGGRKIALLEAELAAPGREVAYIARARNAFPGRRDAV